MSNKSKENEKRVFTFKVVLDYIDPPIWRRFQIDDDATLGDLHYTLQGVMGWSNSHLHEFIIKKESYGIEDPDDSSLYPVNDEDLFLIRELIKRKNTKFKYIYDFGDSWEHTITFEGASETKPDATNPVCIDGARSCPPEDCGSIPGYYRLLKILQDPSHEEYESYRDWIGEDFDPECFDLAKVNKDIQSQLLQMFFDEDAEEDMDDYMPVIGNYSEPVCQLLKLGEPKKTVDYQALGIGKEHVAELIQMAWDMGLHQSLSSSAEVWGTLHAWRALGQLRAEEAIEPLVQLMCLAEELEDDWLDEDLPQSIAQIGATAIPALKSLLQDASKGLWARACANDTLKIMAELYPETRDECVAILTGQLELYDARCPELNAFIIDSLLDLKALESAPVMEQAFSAKCVSAIVVGDWQDVQIELGLLDKRTTPRSRADWLIPNKRIENHLKSERIPASSGEKQQKPKKKSKDQKNARKKNRRK